MDHTACVDSYAFRRIRAFLLVALCLILTGNSHVNGQGGPLTYVYDELGRLVAVVDPNGDTARYSYDAVGNLLSISRFSSSIVSILHFSPNNGAVGTPVTIYGTSFSTTAGSNTVTFNGVAAVVTASTATQILTTVPAGATTGPIAITTPAGSATSSTPFTVGNSDAPTITEFSPTSGVAGTSVTITGTNFESSPGNNRVKINETHATVTSATATTIVTSVPALTASGRIKVSTPAGSTVSTADFIIPPSPYTATDLAYTSRMAFGESKTVSLATPNKIGIVLFEGNAGQRMSLHVSNSTMSWAQVSVLNPNGTSLISPAWTNGPAFFDPRVLTATGTYTIVVDPENTNTGSMTLQLYDVPPDVTGTITPNGAAVTRTTTTPGQNARSTFSGTAGQRVSLQISSATTGWTQISIINPDGTVLLSPSWTNGSGFFDPKVLPATGTYTILADPENANIGSVSMSLYAVPADVTNTITPGGSPLTITTTSPGQNAIVTFSGTAAQRISLNLTNVTTAWTRVSITNPDGTALLSPSWTNGPGYFDTKVLPATGTYTILLDPENANIGSATLTLYDVPADVTSSITSGGAPVTVTTTTPGQNARVTFAGTSGAQAALVVSNVTISGTGWSQVSILKPDGTALVSPSSMYLNGKTFDTVTLPATGTYTIVVDPEGANTGSVALTLSDPSTTVAATLQADYRFQNTRNSTVSSPPALVDLGTNSFASATVDGTSTTVLAFNQNDGLSFSPTTGVVTNYAYSVVMLFSFSQTSSYRRVADFKNGTSDNGLYVQGGHLYFYPSGFGSPVSISANTYVQVVLTRTAAGVVTGYVDGVQQFQFTDSSSLGIVDSNNTLRFFRDDGSANEASAGSVARIRLYNGALTATEVAALERLP